MGIGVSIQKKFLGAKELYNNFMWSDSEERNASLVSKRENILKAEEAKKAELAEKKLSKKAKADRDYIFFKSMADEKGIEVHDASELTEEEKPSFLRKVLNNFVEEDEEPDEVLEEGYSKFWNDKAMEFTAKIANKKQLLDGNYSVADIQNGISLLKRDLNSDKLFISDNDDILRVKSVIRVSPKLPSLEVAYLLFETNRGNYVIEFDISF